MVTFLQDMADDLPGAFAAVSSPSSSSGEPCDIYQFNDTPCGAAFSTTRAMYSSYGGPLYQVQRTSDNATRDIGVLSPGGYADASQQNSFCAGTSCTITKIYDQSPAWNDLTIFTGQGSAAGPDHGADASALPITAGNHQVYGVDFSGQTGYRNDNTSWIATGDQPEGMYMVASGTNVNSECCFDFGNAEHHDNDTGSGHMDAVNFGTKCYNAPCSGTGPWVQADLENGLFQGGGPDPSNLANQPATSDFVTAMLKNQGGGAAGSDFALKSGDAKSGGLTTQWNGSLPTNQPQGSYIPMQKEGSIILGTGGDNSNSGVGSFFEGVMTQGYPSDAADDAVQANIVSAGYNGNTNPGGSGSTGGSTQVAGPAVVHSAGATGAAASGYTSVYTVDAQNGDLQESYLPSMGADWKTQDLTQQPGGGGPPPVKQGTTPVAIVHDGYTSVFTISASDNHVWETYLSNIGNTWASHDLTAIANTPPSKVTPTALYHDGYTSVYTIDASNGDLNETFLTAIGQQWQSQDLSGKYHTPVSQPGTAPVSLYHDGYVSVFTVGTNHDIEETYLSNIGNGWATHDLTQLSGGPQTTTTLTAVYHDGYTSVYAAGDPLRHLWELYLPAIGDAWKSQDLTAGGPKTPPVAPGTAPVALFHTGYTSVYTVGQGSMHVEETYLSNIGNSWATQDFSKYGTPPTTETPMVVVHPDTNGAFTYTSVYTIDQFDNDLQETFLQAIGDNWNTQDLSYKYHTPPVMVDASPTASWSVAHDGRTAVFTVSPKTGDLMLSYLTAMGASWQTQDLTTTGGADQPMEGTQPVAVAWAGHVTVFTIGTKGHLWETYLSALGAQWTSEDLTATTGAPVSAVTPTAVFHGGYVSVYTVDDNTDQLGDLEETFLPLGSTSWQTQDLSQKYKTPVVAAGTSPVALYHDGYTSVFTADDSGHDLQETFLPSIGSAWQTHDLTQIGGAPKLPDYSSPTALYHSGYTSVYELDGDGHVWETYLPAIGDSWSSQDLTANYQVPNVPVTEDDEGVEVPVTSSITAVYHSGYASIFTMDRSADVHESFLPAMSDSWQTQDLTSSAHIPAASLELPSSALVHYDTNGGLTYTSLFTLNSKDLSLQETFLQKIGDDWYTQGLPS